MRLIEFRHLFKKGERFCFHCFQAVCDLAYAEIGDLNLEVAKYKCYKKKLKLLDRANWDETKSPLYDYCLECGEKRCIATEDCNLPLDRF